MKKRFLLTISILTLGLCVKAQSAEQVFKNAVDRLKAYNNIEIGFDYQMKNAEAGIDEVMTGDGFLQGNAYKINIAGQDMICDGETLWTYLADSEEVMISSVDTEENSSPLAMITSYYDNVTAKFVDNDDNSLKSIEITPISGDENFIKLIVVIESKTLDLKEARMFDNNGSEFVYRLTKFVTNQELPANFFTFNAQDYPDAEIIDMR